mmetsp:Transcript_25904/g.68477  ORF Transcript_25904/g.68477 Transcript_25904/m.68477 type:complete len:284 (+) Transcript_25904:94-945(+)
MGDKGDGRGKKGGDGGGKKGDGEIQQVYERNQEATIYVGNLDPKIDEEVLWELMVQCGPVANIHLPRDKITNTHQGYGFVEFKNEEDSDYTIKIMNMIRLFGKPIRCNKSSQDKKTNEVGANLFIGNLEPEVDEKMLYDTFSSFGVLLFAKVMRDPDTGTSRGFGFISYDGFDASDAALAGMNGQFLCNRPISCSYAYKKETKGERHGSAAERLIASNSAGLAIVAGGGDRPPPATLASKGEAPPAPRMSPPGLPPGMPPPPGMGMGGPPPGMPPPMPGAGMS